MLYWLLLLDVAVLPMSDDHGTFLACYLYCSHFLSYCVCYCSSEWIFQAFGSGHFSFRSFDGFFLCTCGLWRGSVILSSIHILYCMYKVAEWGIISHKAPVEVTLALEN